MSLREFYEYRASERMKENPDESAWRNIIEGIIFLGAGIFLICSIPPEKGWLDEIILYPIPVFGAFKILYGFALLATENGS